MTLKRKPTVSDHLQRRVKPRRDDSEDELSSGSSSDHAPTHDEAAATDSSSEGSDGADETDGSEQVIDHEDPLDEDLGSISFGALAKAADSLSSKPPSTTPTSASSKLDLLRQRLRELKEENGVPTEDSSRSNRHKDHPPSRSSKHAPTEMSSRKAVTRRREVVPVPKRDIRDPRFEPLSGPIDEEKMRANYKFLEAYREDEMKQLKEGIRKTKDEESKARLKRELLSMESKKKAQANKDKQQEILRKHRTEEKELVKQGKKPFYLKKAEQKKLALIDRYSGLKGKQLDRVMERRQKKKAGKERKMMPDERRGVAGGE